MPKLTGHVSHATLEHERDEQGRGRYHPMRRWTHYMRNLIAWNHDAKARGGINDGLIRAERWHAVY